MSNLNGSQNCVFCKVGIVEMGKYMYCETIGHLVFGHKGFMGALNVEHNRQSISCLLKSCSLSKLIGHSLVKLISNKLFEHSLACKNSALFLITAVFCPVILRTQIKCSTLDISFTELQ